MPTPRPFVLELGWSALLEQFGLRSEDLLKEAGLPEDLFSEPRPTLPPADFFRLITVLKDRVDDPLFPLRIGQAIQPEVFSPPMFAAFCSPDLRTAMVRLSHYKPLIGPMRLDVRDTSEGLEVVCDFEDCEGPEGFHQTELVILTHLARLGTKRRIVPRLVEMVEPLDAPEYVAFFGCRPKRSDVNRLVFAKEDANQAFVAVNPALFEMFEPDLQKRLHELNRRSTFPERVRTVLMEALPSGQADAVAVAKRLGVSSRSLQRRLAEDGTSFKAELQALRTRLAENYLAEQHYTFAEIAFLLGYADPNSFFRAFRTWTGTTPETKRKALMN